MLYVTCGQLCYKIIEDSVKSVDELKLNYEETESNHEEADIRLFLHANHIAQSNYTAVTS